MTTTGKPPCYNRQSFAASRLVQDGWKLVGLDGEMTRTPVMRVIPDEMSKTCQQWGPLGEARLHDWNCNECRWHDQTKGE